MLNLPKSINFLDEYMEDYLGEIPKPYYFDTLQGIFRDETKPITDDDNELLKTFSIIPVACRFFEHKLFKKDKPDLYAELYFHNEDAQLSNIMFKNSSVKALRRLCAELFYDDLNLIGIVLNISSTEKISKNNEKWYLAEFTYELL